MRYLLFLRLATLENPVLLKELRIGLREKRMFATQLIFLIILLMVTLAYLPAMLSNSEPEQLPEVGKNFFEALFWVQLVVLALITPGLTCGSLSGERERHSLDMVLASRLSSAEIVAGKLGYAVYNVVLLLFSSLPIASVAFFLGGISPLEAAQSYFQLLLFGVLAALTGLFFSARETRSNYATSQTYLTVFLSSFFLPFFVAARTVDPSQMPELMLSPMGLVYVAVAYATFFLFVKAMHRLKPQNRNIALMGLSFMAMYGLSWFILLAALSGVISNDTGSPSDWAALLVGCGIAHLVWVGMFCNDTELHSSKEERAFTRNPFSKNIFWMGFLCLGVATPAVYLQMKGMPQGNLVVVSTGCLLIALYVLVFPLLARALQGMISGGRFAAIYFPLVALAVVLPTLGLLLDHPGPFSGVYLSPLLALASLGETENAHFYWRGAGYGMASFSAAAYTVLALLASLALRLQRVRKARAGVDQSTPA